MMRTLGLKAYSSNEMYATKALPLIQDRVIQFIEMYALPGTFAAQKETWANLPLPFVIHAPHFKEGFNLSLAEKASNNLVLLEDTIVFARHLKAQAVILHPGVNGTG